MSHPPTPGERLRTLRQHLGLTGQTVANALGMTKTAVSYWECDKVVIPRAVCLAMESLYGVSVDWLMEGAEPMWRPKSKISSTRPDLVFCPLFPEGAKFDDNGTPLPLPNCEEIGLPRSFVSHLDKLPGKASNATRFWIQAADPLMRDTLGTHAVLLIDAADKARLHVVDHSLYLVRLGKGIQPCIRRLAIEPTSGDLVVGVDTRDQVPLRMAQPHKDLRTTILGNVLWILRSAN